MSKFRYEQPPNEDAFEDFCLVLLKETRPRLERYAHRGEEQHGVDLLDMSGDASLFAAQCKHHDPNKSLPPAELEAEVKKALTFPARIGEYVLLTTAKKTGATQLKVRELNEEHRQKGLFSIRLMCWDEIASLVESSPAARAFLGYEPRESVAEAVRSAIQPLHATLTQQGAERFADLDEAKARLDEGAPQEALVFVQRARRRWTDLTPAQRARACGLEADARVRLGEPDTAARLFLEARTHSPEDQNVIVNEIAARRLLGDLEIARELARSARSTFPFSAAAHGASIAIAATAADAIALIAEVPSTIGDAPDVLGAIAERVDLGERAATAARRVVELEPGEPQAWYALGNLLLEVELAKATVAGPGIDGASVVRLSEARAAFARSMELAAKRGDKYNQLAGLLRKIIVSGLLRDEVEVQREAAAAMQLAPENVHALIAGGRAAIDRGDLEASVNILRRAVTHGQTNDARFFLGAALFSRNASGDRAEAVLLLADVARHPGGPRELAADMSVEGFLRDADYPRALELVDAVAGEIEPALVATLRARIAGASKADGVAREHADAAVLALSEETASSTRVKLAKVLAADGRYAAALDVLERVALPGGDEDAGRLLVECAVRLERHVVVLRYCAGMRERGVFDDYLLAHELRLLDQYDPSLAMTVLRAVLARDAGKHGARVHLMVLAFRLGQPDVALEYADGLPRVTEVEPDEGAAVVALLVELGRGRDAIAFAYDLLRLHFDDHRAHRAFRDAVIRVDREDKPLDAPEAVAPGVAVSITEDGQSARWYVIEDSPLEAVRREHELRPEDGLARLLIGKKVGDEVVLSDGPGVRRVAKVQDIVTKHVFRVRDVWQQWQLRFPEQQELWMVRTGDQEEPDFKALFEMLAHQREQTERIEELYRAHPMPLAVLAKLLHTNEIRALGHLASHESLRVRCCSGTVEECEQAASNLGAASEVVLELSAIGTLVMAESFELLESLGKPLLVSHSTLAVLRALADDARKSVGSRGSLGATRDGPRLEITSDEVKEATVAFFDRVLRWFETHVMVVGALEIAEHEPTMRTELSELLGRAGLESATIASRPNRVLLTDDGVLAVVVRGKLGVRTVWTQATTNWLLSQGRIDAERHARLSARLISWGYDFTSANQATMQAAGRLADWRPDATPLKQAIDYLTLSSVALQDAVRLAALLAKEAYTEIVLPDRRGRLLVSLLDALGRRSDADHRALNGLRTMLPRVFGLNVLGCGDAQRTYDAWRAAHRLRPVQGGLIGE